MNLVNCFSPADFITEIREVRRNEATYPDDNQLCSGCGNPTGDENLTSVAWMLLGVAITLSAQAAIHALSLPI
jgi:hypothetical protein